MALLSARRSNSIQDKPKERALHQNTGTLRNEFPHSAAAGYTGEKHFLEGLFLNHYRFLKVNFQ